MKCIVEEISWDGMGWDGDLESMRRRHIFYVQITYP